MIDELNETNLLEGAEVNLIKQMENMAENHCSKELVVPLTADTKQSHEQYKISN